MKKTGLFSIEWRDAIKGFITAMITGGIGVISTILDNGGLPTIADWRVIGIAALGAGISHLIRKYFTNSDGQFAKKEVIK